MRTPTPPWKPEKRTRFGRVFAGVHSHDRQVRSRHSDMLPVHNRRIEVIARSQSPAGIYPCQTSIIKEV